MKGFIAVAVALLLFSLAGCAPRGEIAFGPPAASATQHKVWVANFRATDPPAAGDRSPPRPEDLRFSQMTISVPATHETGQIEWPAAEPNAETDFVTLARAPYDDARAFARAVARSDTRQTGETLVYVHGFNYTHAEAVYQAAQIAHDFGVPSPMAVFSWPSAGVPVGYLYDRDSALIARDQLENLLVALTRGSNRKVILLGHSMGNFLIMETLRQIEISGSLDISRDIDSLIMVSPDIDGELFYTQASRLSQMPSPSAIIAVAQDSALRLSARLTGRTNRLGSEVDRGVVRDLPIALIDASDLADGGTNHSIGFTSPAAISILKNIDPTAIPGELQSGAPIKITDLR
ncbi:MAG: alpha/beta fold hydrolase [Pseudomonadota bacterium]